jgi:hypothetical protein
MGLTDGDHSKLPIDEVNLSPQFLPTSKASTKTDRSSENKSRLKHTCDTCDEVFGTRIGRLAYMGVFLRMRAPARVAVQIQPRILSQHSHR